MNDDELKDLWQQQPLRQPAPSAAQLVSAMQNKMTGLRRLLNARDLRELVACAVVIIIFGVFYFTVYHTPVSRVGDLIVIGAVVFIAWKIVHTRRTTPPSPPGATVVESLQAELNSVRAQSRMLKSVFWWYLLPGLIGVLIATWGLRIDLFTKILTSLVFLAVDAVIWWVNQIARSKQLLPAEAQLESLLHSAETGEPLEETQMAGLRPIILSMEAADQVKPVEFKVAFWQVAIFGLPGIVGIWFFLMLSLAIDNAGGKSQEQSPKTITPIFRVAETNRYSVAARKVVEPLNAGDFAVVQKLFNPEMSKVLPPEKAVEFFTSLVERYGNIEKVGGPTTNGNRGWTAFRLDCHLGAMTMSLALDADDKISGLYFQPTPSPFGSNKWIISRIFTWPRLLWLVPFFLGGLLYSWLIQKTTGRAVGISSLGIHLHKGQHLILWNEIAEVRPFRFLHIQNLWLIRESGEKTLMHWTPLERHADLKAAAEAFAPANHPLRNHLPLLKRIKRK